MIDVNRAALVGLLRWPLPPLFLIEWTARTARAEPSSGWLAWRLHVQRAQSLQYMVSAGLTGRGSWGVSSRGLASCHSLLA